MAEAIRRNNWWKTAVVAVVAIELLGGLSGWLSNSGYGNGWFDGLQKPSFMPPGWTFGVVWPILYALLGIALAVGVGQVKALAARIAGFFEQLLALLRVVRIGIKLLVAGLTGGQDARRY